MAVTIVIRTTHHNETATERSAASVPAKEILCPSLIAQTKGGGQGLRSWCCFSKHSQVCRLVLEQVVQPPRLLPPAPSSCAEKPLRDLPTQAPAANSAARCRREQSGVARPVFRKKVAASLVAIQMALNASEASQMDEEVEKEKLLLAF